MFQGSEIAVAEIFSVQNRNRFMGFKAFVLTPKMGITLLLMLAMAVLIIPLPTWLIDVMVSINLLLALYLLIKTLYVKDSLELTTFPTLLLLTTIFRLAVSIATTRAILSTGSGGDVIQAFGEFVVAGNVVVGLVVFLVIAIVQFIVITKGGERVAEVSARFVLDALPGKQMSIDADLKAGDISREEARARRKRLQSESEFFGAMDGAMRFVKGDCIATMFIVVVNLIGGILIGVVGKGMSIDAAAKAYSILSIGDGLVAQIPSILSSLAAGMLTTRMNAEDASKDGLAGDIASQLLNENRSLIVAALAIGFMGLVPGFPAFVLIPLGGLIIFFTLVPKIRHIFNARFSKKQSGDVLNSNDTKDALSQHEPLPVARFNDPIRVIGRSEVLSQLHRAGISTQLPELILKEANAVGCALHQPKFVIDTSASANGVDIHLEGIFHETIPVPITGDMKSVLEALVRISRSFSMNAFGIDDASEWLETQERVTPKLVNSITQQVPLPLLAGILGQILREGVAISHPRAMLEELLLSVETKFTVEELVEAIRPRILTQILARNTDGDGRVKLVEIGTGLEELSRSLSGNTEIDLEEFDNREGEAAKLVAKLRDAVIDLSQHNERFILVVPDEIRFVLARRLADFGCACNVISVSEADSVRKPDRLSKINLLTSQSKE